MADHLAALQTSVERLHGIAAGLEPAQLELSAYPTEWTVADTLSHIGSGAVIMRTRLDDVLAGAETDDGMAPTVWDEWNAKLPVAQRDDALDADAALVARLSSLTDDERAGLVFELGPMKLDFPGLVQIRLNEHALHTWDVEVTFDPAAGVAPASVDLVIDNLEMLVGFASRPIGDTRDIHVHTTAPDRDFTLAFRPESVALEPQGAGAVDLDLPAESFIRLIYGRLDPEHTPASVSGAGGPALVDDLRKAFPGL